MRFYKNASWCSAVSVVERWRLKTGLSAWRMFARGQKLQTPGRSLFVVLILSFVALSLVRITLAQEGATFEAEAGADYQFGQMMRFWLNASAATELEAATLFIRVAQSPSTVSIDVPVQSGTTLEASHDLDLTSERLAPFATINYWWQLQDSKGELYTVPQRSIEYADDRFEWQQLEKDNVAIHWTGDDSSLGQTGLDVVSEVLPQIQKVVPVALDEPLRIYIYPSADDMRSALRLTGRDWVGAHAHPELGVILVPATNPRTASVDLGQSIPHELSHLLLYRAIGQAYESAPRWFDEGLAVSVEGAENSTYDNILREHAAAGDLISFDDLCRSFPAENDQALLAYAESGSLVRFIRAQYGEQRLAAMVGELGDGADCQSVTTRALGLPLDELEERWQAQQQPRSALSVIWQRGGIWLILLAAGFALMGFFLLQPHGPKEHESAEQ